MEPPKRKRFLFLHAESPTQRRTRSQALDSMVRRHLMVDIGRSRRKASKNSPFETLVWHAETSKPQTNTHRGDHPTSGEMRDSYSHAPMRDLAAPTRTAAPFVTPPILQALSIFEEEWGEDWFSAYGFTLIMVAGRNAISSGENPPLVFRELDSHHLLKLLDTARSTSTFWFPFAFRNSAFLHHYQQLFTSPHALVPLYRRSARELRSLALERSLVTIQCVESRIASSDTSSATSDSVISAVLALVCFNVSPEYGWPGLERAANALCQVDQLRF